MIYEIQSSELPWICFQWPTLQSPHVCSKDFLLEIVLFFFAPTWSGAWTTLFVPRKIICHLQQRPVHRIVDPPCPGSAHQLPGMFSVSSPACKCSTSSDKWDKLLQVFLHYTNRCILVMIQNGKVSERKSVTFLWLNPS